jgi:hypothetical protein
MHILLFGFAILVALAACTSRETPIADRKVTPLPPQVVTPVNPPPCSLNHDWSTRDAWLGNPAPSAPALPWLFINNLNAPND